MYLIRNVVVVACGLGAALAAAPAFAVSYTNDACVYYSVEAYGGTQADTAVDASGNGQDGIADGAVFPQTPTAGINGNSANFPGGGDIYVAGEVPPSGSRFRNQTLDLSTNDFTIVMWVRATAAYNVPNGADGLVFRPDPFNVFLSQSGTVAFTVPGDSASMASSNSYAIPVNSQWYHVAVVVDRDNAGGNASRIYVNSCDVTDDPMEATPTSMTPGANEFWVWGRALTGQGDDFAIFKESLSQAEIVALNGISPTTSTSTLTSTSSTTTDTSTTSTTGPLFGYGDACVWYPVEAYGGTQSDTVPDASGNGQDGIADGGLFPLGTAPGLNGNSAIFPGGNDVYVAGELPPSSSRFRNYTLDLDTNDYTIVMWVRATAAYGTEAPGDGTVWRSNINGEFTLFLSKNGTVAFTVPGDSASMASSNSYAIPVNSQWYHVAVVVDRDNAGGNASRIYVNSCDVTDDPMEATPTSMTPGANEFWVWGRALTGQGDDFAIFKESLSQAEIVALNGISPTTSTLTSTSSTTTATSTTSTTAPLFGYGDACVWYPVEFYTNVTDSVTVLDGSGNGQDGVGGGGLTGAGQPVAGINGNSAVFPGGGDIYVAGEMPPSSSRFRNQTLSLDTNDFTITMWVRATDAYNNSEGGNGLVFRPTHYNVFLSKNGTIEIEVPGDSAAMASTSGTDIPVDSEWYHVAVVVNRDNTNGNPSAIYRDSTDVTGANSMENTPTPIGADNGFDVFGRTLVGQGDDIAIFKEALSQADIITLNGIVPTTSTSTLTSTTSTTTDSSSTSTTTTTSTTAPVVSYADACVYYPVEAYGGTMVDTVPDASGNGQDGIADGGLAPLPPTAGLNGNSAIFPGGNDVYIAGEMPPSSSRFRNRTLDLGTGDYTITMWVRATDAYDIPNGPDGKVWSIHNDKDENLYLSRAGTITFEIIPDGAVMATTNNGDIPVNSEWYHVAVVVNRDNLGGNPSAIYVNGINATGADTMEDTPTSLTPGLDEFWLWGRALNGQGDDFAIFKDALSANEIRILVGLKVVVPPMILIIR